MRFFESRPWRRVSWWVPSVKIETPEMVTHLRCAVKRHPLNHQWGMSAGGPYTETCKCGHRHGDTYVPNWKTGNGEYVKAKR